MPFRSDLPLSFHGLSWQVRYYASGLLSLQAALDDAILGQASLTQTQPDQTKPNQTLDDAILRQASLTQTRPNQTLSAAVVAPPKLYASPYPVPAYTHNQFFDHAGSLVGLVIVLSVEPSTAFHWHPTGLPLAFPLTFPWYSTGLPSGLSRSLHRLPPQVIVLSFLIPVSAMLRSVVLERETKLREQVRHLPASPRISRP